MGRGMHHHGICTEIRRLKQLPVHPMGENGRAQRQSRASGSRLDTACPARIDCSNRVRLEAHNISTEYVTKPAKLTCSPMQPHSPLQESIALCSYRGHQISRVHWPVNAGFAVISERPMTLRLHSPTCDFNSTQSNRFGVRPPATNDTPALRRIGPAWLTQLRKSAELLADTPHFGT